MKNEEELKPGDGVVIDDKTKYEYGSNLDAEPVPLIDPAIGKTVTIRTFEFKMNPDPVMLNNFPDQQTLFNSHARQIKTILWSDGLVPLDGISPRVIINKKARKYQIFITCKAKLNTIWPEKPKNLVEAISQKQ